MAPSGRLALVAGAIGGVAAASAALVTALAAELGAGAPLLGLAAGGAIAVLGAVRLPRVIGRALRRSAQARELAIAPQPAGPALTAERPEELLDGVFAREEARLEQVIAAERERAAAELARAWAGQGAARGDLEALGARAEAATAEAALHRDHALWLTHTLAVPLTAANSAIELALDRDLPAGHAQLLGLARGSAQAALRQLERVAALVTVPLERVPALTQSFSPRRVIVGLLRALSPEANRRGVELVARFTEEVPSRASGDPERLEQVLGAFVSWALARSRANTIQVSCALRSATPAHDGAVTPLVLTVEDSGPALDEAAAAELFTWSPGPTGAALTAEAATQLGLAAARRLLVGHDGATWVEGSSPVATRLGFSFPVVRQKRVTVTTLYGRGAVTEKSVLVVDDQSASRAALSELLSSWRLLPTAVASASAAVAALQAAARAQQPFDVVLLDRQLGTGRDDGCALMREVALAAELGPQRVLLLETPADLGRPLADDLRAQIAGRVLKPVLPGELIEALTTALAPPRAAPRPQPRAAPVSDPSRRPARVLVAEDNAINRLFLMRMLEKRGYQVTAANNGADAIDCIDTSAEPFDVVLMDIQMPVLDGSEATAILRERERRTGGPRQPIVAVTAHAMAGEQERTLAGGFDGYVPKPIEEERLLATIAAVLPAAAASRPAPAGAPVFDEAKVLAFVAGDMAFLRSLVDLFVTTSPRQVAAVGAAVVAGDAPALERAAHQLKGSISNFAAEAARASAGLLEQAGRFGQLDGAAEILGRLEVEVQALCDGLRDLAARHGA